MSGGLLLDTCAVIWIASDAGMSKTATAAINDALADSRPVAVSLITAWELGLLSGRGRLPSARPPELLFHDFVNAAGVSTEPLTAAVLVASSFLPGEVQGDPADRIIVATARARGLTIVTRDRRMLDYAGSGYVQALEC